MRTTTWTVSADKTVPLPKLLLSVRNVEELEIAFDSGTPWIDVKEPNHGPLGRADRETAWSIYEAFIDRESSETAEPTDERESTEERRPVELERHFSVALGELMTASDEEIARYCNGFGEQVYWKVGLAQTLSEPDWLERLTRRVSLCSVPRQWILVHYADAEKADARTWDEILQASKTLGCEFILVDTWEKCGKSLLDICELDTLKHMAAHAHAMGLSVAVAGSLQIDQLLELADVGPDWIGFRGAMCSSGQRDAPLDRSKLDSAVDRFQSFKTPPPQPPSGTSQHNVIG